MSARLDTAAVTRAMLASATAPRCATRWSAEDVAFLREHYRRRGCAWVAAKLGRSRCSVFRRAQRDGVRRQAWTAREAATLMREWGEVAPRELRRKLPGRSWAAIVSRARVLRLPSASRGVVSILEATRLTGLSRPTLLRVLAEAGVRVMRRRASTARRGETQAAYRWWVVDPDEACDAVRAWLDQRRAHLTWAQAAAHCGVCGQVMRRAMRSLAAVRPVDGFRADAAWRVSAADAEAAVALDRVRMAERAAYRRGVP